MQTGDGMSGSDISGLRERYEEAFGGSLVPGERPALLLVDLVVAYLDESSALYAGPGAATARDAAGELVAAARTHDVPVVWTTVTYAEDGRDGGLFFRKVPSLALFAGAAPLGAFPDAVSPADGELVVTKQFPSAFFGTDLAERLHADGIDTLLIGGYSTSGCVRASALDALCHGFVPLVVREATADRHEAPHEQALFDLQAKYAEVIDVSTAKKVIAAYD